MNFPETPQTILAQLTEPDKIGIWNGAWRRFFDIYHAPIKVMVYNSFWKHGSYAAPSFVADEVIADVIVNLNKTFAEGKYERSRSKFRFFLKTICDRRVVDYIRQHSKSSKNDSIDDSSNNLEKYLNDIYAESLNTQLEQEEIKALRESIILDAYMTIRHNFDARTCMAFEMVKLEDMDKDDVVKELGVSAGVINNAVYKIMKKLKEVISNDETMKDL